MEYTYAFIKNNRVANVLVFDEPNKNELLEQVKDSLNADLYIPLYDYQGEETPSMYWSYIDGVFEKPTEEYLISIGVMTPSINLVVE